MSAAKIVLIGSSGAKQDPLIVALEKRYMVFVAHSGKQGLALTKKHNPQVVILDAISLRTPGDRICQNLQDNLTGIPIIHLYPGPGKRPKCQPDVVLVEPFTWRKVVNGIERLLMAEENDHIITCGPFSMNIDRRVLIAHGHETPLTPKQALLIETFLRHPGETLPRKLLMERVWDTDYMGDTRTLDVHIRWVRKSLESDPRKPRYLKTVRGVGYRLELPTT
jgi:DNA-binding response OmpR family regulator